MSMILYSSLLNWLPCSHGFPCPNVYTTVYPQSVNTAMAIEHPQSVFNISNIGHNFPISITFLN